MNISARPGKATQGRNSVSGGLNTAQRKRLFSGKPPMAALRLTTVTRTQGTNQALKDGSVKPASFAFDFVEVNPLIDAFRRMVRGLEFDISEMAISTYICARAHGKRMTAIPVFLVRAFHHGAILVNTKAGIRTPKDLEGKRVGVNRGYTVTTGVWARGVLQEEHGVDLKKITWVLSGDEHVAEYVPPKNVVPIEKGKTMADMLASGELLAAIGVEIDHPDVKPLIPNALEAGLAALKARGHYPVNHTVVIKDELLAKHPGLAADVFDAFARSKQLYLERLKSGRIEKPTDVDKVHARVMEIAGDPLPYGIAPNRRVIETLIGHALTQGIITKPVTVEDLFAAETLTLAS
jgi:4,5-dihydroxyphthalate decarboxylase